MANNLGEAAIPLYNNETVALNSTLPAKVDTSIPLAVKDFKPVDDQANQLRAYSLADADMKFKEKKEEFDTQQADKQVLDDWTQQGGKLNSVEDFEKAKTDLLPKLSPEGQLRFKKLATDHEVADLDLQRHIAQGDDFKVAQNAKHLSDMAEVLDPAVETYKKAYSTAVTQEEKDNATKAFQASRDAGLQMLSQLQGVDGKPLYNAKEIQALAPLSPDQMEHTLAHTKYIIDKHEQVLADRLKEANIGKAESQAVLNTARAEDLPEKERIAQEKLNEMIKAKSLTPENLDSVATAIANYKLPPLASYSMKTPQGLAIMSKVAEMNPDYDAKKFKAMQGTLDKYTYGKGSEVITAFKTANSHLDALGDVVDQLDNGDEKSLNRLGNAFAKEFNLSKAPGDFDAMKQAIAQEIEKTFSGSAGALADRQELEKSLDAAKSPENLKSVIGDYKRLLQGKIAASKESFESGMAATPNFELKPKQTPATFPKGTPGDTDKGKAEQLKILTDEKTEIEKRLAAAATPEDKQRAQADLDAITKELAAKSGGAAPAAGKPTTSNW